MTHYIDRHVDDDVACSTEVCGVVPGSWLVTGAWGVGWGELGRLGGVLERRLGRWGWWSCSVECTTRSDEHTRTTSHNGVPLAVDGVVASFTAW